MCYASTRKYASQSLVRPRTELRECRSTASGQGLCQRKTRGCVGLDFDKSETARNRLRLGWVRHLRKSHLRGLHLGPASVRKRSGPNQLAVHGLTQAGQHTGIHTRQQVGGPLPERSEPRWLGSGFINSRMDTNRPVSSLRTPIVRNSPQAIEPENDEDPDILEGTPGFR